MRTLPLVALASALSLTSASAQAQIRPAICTAKPAPALDFVLRDLSGAAVPLRSFAGKVVLLNFWATWCVPCRTEIPALTQLQDKYRRQGVAIVGIDVAETGAVVAEYSKTIKLGYTNLLAGDRKDILDAFDIDVGLPTTIVVDRTGTVCRRRVGLTRKETFEQLIRALL